jgi:hypothetical protein
MVRRERPTFYVFLKSQSPETVVSGRRDFWGFWGFWGLGKMKNRIFHFFFLPTPKTVKTPKSPKKCFSVLQNGH